MPPSSTMTRPLPGADRLGNSGSASPTRPPAPTTGTSRRRCKAKLPLAKGPLAGPVFRPGDREPCQGRRWLGNWPRWPPAWIRAGSPRPRNAGSRTVGPDALIRQRRLQPPPTAPKGSNADETQINMFERHLRAIDRKMQQLIAAARRGPASWRSSPRFPGSRPHRRRSAGRDARAGRPQRKAAASLAGLAAVPRESGTWQGRA